MKVELNTRGNGACPICEFNRNCGVQDILKKTMAEFSSEEDPMEMVIYSCPGFREKTE